MKHPWQELIKKIKERNLTQKDFSLLLWKKVSELNELIKWKRNITIQWDLLLSDVLNTPEKYRILKQIDYDYYKAKNDFSKDKNLKENKKNKEQKFNINKQNINTQEEKKFDKLEEKKFEKPQEDKNFWSDSFKNEDIVTDKIEHTEQKEDLIKKEIVTSKKEETSAPKIDEFVDDYPDFDKSPEIDALDHLDEIDINEISNFDDKQESNQDGFDKTKNENIFIDF